MHETGIKLLQLMFKDGERICCSSDKYGYHSIPLENAFMQYVTLISPNDKIPIKKVESDSLLLVALNPMKSGYRLDANTTAFRNFLIEMDNGTPKEQMDYIEKLSLPYSAVVFSGNKSLHFLISLDIDLDTEYKYRMIAEWILNIITLADQNCKNPSRSIRIPGSYREPGKKQRLVKINGKVKLNDLMDWLEKRPEARPEAPVRRNLTAGDGEFKGIPSWVMTKLHTQNVGASTGSRNSEWYSIACECAKANLSLDAALGFLEKYFNPDRSFTKREWRTTIKSAYKRFVR